MPHIHTHAHTYLIVKPLFDFSIDLVKSATILFLQLHSVVLLVGAEGGEEGGRGRAGRMEEKGGREKQRGREWRERREWKARERGRGGIRDYVYELTAIIGKLSKLYLQNLKRLMT